MDRGGVLSAGEGGCEWRTHLLGSGIPRAQGGCQPQGSLVPCVWDTPAAVCMWILTGALQSPDSGSLPWWPGTLLFKVDFLKVPVLQSTSVGFVKNRWVDSWGGPLGEAVPGTKACTGKSQDTDMWGRGAAGTLGDSVCSGSIPARTQVLLAPGITWLTRAHPWKNTGTWDYVTDRVHTRAPSRDHRKPTGQHEICMQRVS